MKIISDFGAFAAHEILAPAEQRVPFIFNSPHSGRCYPQSFLEESRLNHVTIRRSEDAFVDDLFMIVAAQGAPLLRAHFPRAYLDVNREPYELDPKMYQERLPSYANIRSIRVAGGLGTIARVVGEAQEIYRRRLSVQDAIERIETLYKPYHKTLRRLLAKTHVDFGYAVLIDCHSMPSSVQIGNGRTLPDFILGDRFGASCHSELIDVASDILTGLGYHVSRNKPYAGGFITEHYGRPAKGLHALQIEINRSLYMDETKACIHSGFTELAQNMEKFTQQLISMPDRCFNHEAFAAE